MKPGMLDHIKKAVEARKPRGEVGMTEPMLGWVYCDMVLNELADARRAAFEQAASLCERRKTPSGGNLDVQARNAAIDGCAATIRAAALEETSGVRDSPPGENTLSR